ncbi:MAG: UDP-N-acetylmuramate dehydrogenase [Terracidiphilus sp.]|jgi:UDP-N-acetylmuramate dehydrogenase
MLLEENKPLAPFTTFGIGGPARWFVEAASEDEVVAATAWARERGTRLFVLGGGSNLLVSDAGFDGLVLRVGLRGIVVAPVEDQDDCSSRIPAEHTSGAKAQAQSAAFAARLKPHSIDEDLSMGTPVKSCPDTKQGFSAACKALTYQVAAGEDWEHCVQQTIEDGCAGLECLAGIPGTVGGTPVQNVGAYGQEVASVIERVRAFDLRQEAFVEFTAAECGFSYRRSRFNSVDRGRYIVTRVDYRLTPGGAPTLRYAELERAVLESRPEGGEASLAEVAAVVRRVRRSKGMLLVDGDPDCRSAGSFFKNPVVSEEQVRRIAECSEKEPPRFPAEEGAGNIGLVKVPAAWLIEQAGFKKGYALGAAGISSRHTLALVNRGGASAAEILALADRITDAVEARFGIRLEMEPVMVGFVLSQVSESRPGAPNSM